MATKKTGANPEFLYVPIGNIIVLEQVRSNINIEAESFKSLMQSIKDKGIINSGKQGSRGQGFEGSRVRGVKRKQNLFTVPRLYARSRDRHSSQQSTIQAVFHDALSALSYYPPRSTPVLA